MKLRKTNVAVSVKLASATAFALLILWFGASAAIAQGPCKTTQTLAKQLAADKAWSELTMPRENGLDGTAAMTLLLHFDFLAKERDCWANRLNGGETKMRGAFLFRADVRRFVEESYRHKDIDLAGADLTGVDLSGAEMPRSTFAETNFSSTKLSQTNLAGADLRAADFFGANLSGAKLAGAHLEQARLQGANLQGADFSGADLTDCGFLDWKAEFDRLTKDNAEFQAGRPEQKRGYEAGFKAQFESRTSGTVLTGAKISKTTKGVDPAFWKARGGIVVD